MPKPSARSKPDQGMQVIGARFPREVLDRLGRAAARLERSVSWCVRKAVEEWLDRQERRK